MAMLFADESGDWNDQDFIALAGLTSSEAGWEALCQEWPILLQKHEIPVVHMKEIMPERGKSAAASWKMDKKLAMIEEFYWSNQKIYAVRIWYRSRREILS